MYISVYCCLVGKFINYFVCNREKTALNHNRVTVKTILKAFLYSTVFEINYLKQFFVFCFCSYLFVFVFN